MAETMRETGFPSPAQGYEAKSFDFNRILVQRPAATFVMEYSSEWAEKGILAGSLLVVDRSVKPRPGALAVLCHEGAFVCREMRRKGGGFAFCGGGDEIPAAEADIFGTVAGVVKLL